MQEYDCSWEEWMRLEAAAGGTTHLQLTYSFYTTYRAPIFSLPPCILARIVAGHAPPGHLVPVADDPGALALQHHVRGAAESRFKDMVFERDGSGASPK